MSSEVEEQFRNYDWSSNSSWQSHLGNLYPVPSGAILEKVKRKWFKKNVNSALDVDLPNSSSGARSDNSNNNEQSGANNRSTGESSHSQQQNTDNNARQQEAPPQQNAGGSSGGFFSKIGSAIGGVFGGIFGALHKVLAPLKDQFYNLEGGLKIAFIITAFLMPGYANMIAFIICILGFFRRTGRPRWNAEYGRIALENDFIQNIFYMVPFAFFPGQKNLMYFLPLGIHFWIGVAEFIKMRLNSVYLKLKKYVDFTIDNKHNLMYQKAKIEIMLFGFLIFMLFFGGSNLLILLFYGNFLKTKWMLNSLTKTAFSAADNWIVGKMAHPYFPGFAKFIVNKVRDFCRYMVKM